MEKIIDLKKTPKKKLVELLQGLSQSDDHYVLKDNDEFLGAVLSRENYEKYLLRWQEQGQKELGKFLDTVHPRMDQNISDEELNKEIVDAVHEMRGIK